jgi:hypothetical protein
MLILIVTIPSSFWMYGDTNTRYGLWNECKLIDKQKNLISNLINNNNNNNDDNQYLKCRLMNKGKINK